MVSIVTGADGFIGSHLVEELVKSGNKVRALCQYNSFGYCGWLEEVSKEVKDEVEVVLGDIRDSYQMNNLCKGGKIVYNLAALIGIPYSYDAPTSYIDTNIIGTANILNACMANNVSRVIQTSTSECYGSAKYVPMDEEHPLNAQSPYAATKIAADQLSLSYHKSFDLPAVVLRPFNTYGPRQSTRAVIPTIITQLLHGNGKVKLGAISPTRDFNYVKDTCRAFIEVGKGEKCIGKVINACSSYEISIKRTAELIAEIMDKELNIDCEQERLRPSKSEVNRLFGSNDLIKSLTDWEPLYNGEQGLKMGLEETIEWFIKRQNDSGYKSAGYAK